MTANEDRLKFDALIKSANEHLNAAETIIRQLHDEGANRAYGLSWAAFCQQFFGKSRYWLYRQLKIADALDTLTELGVANVQQSDAALVEFARVPDEQAALVYDIARTDDGKLTANRVRDALAEINQTIVTRCYEDENGTQHALVEGLGVKVDKNAAERLLARSKVQWLVSHQHVTITGMGQRGNTIELTMTTQEQWDGFPVMLIDAPIVISIGIEDAPDAQ